MQHQAKKRFGQNFLTDKNLLKKIVLAAKIENQNVIEIGPGRGALTQFLTLEAKKYLGYEIDLTLKDYLLKTYSLENTNFIFKDFMEIDLLEDLSTYFKDEKVHLVANLPYYITTPIIFKFLEFNQLESATIMVQKEVGERLISVKNEKSYNALSAILQYYCKVTKVIDVNRKMFNPIPKVDSMVIRLERLPSRTNKEKLYVKLAKALFIQKRKQAANNLSSSLSLNKDQVKEFLVSLGHLETIRAEQLSVDEIILITEKWPF